MVAAAQHVGHAQPPVLDGAGVLRIFEQVFGKALLHERLRREHAVDIPRDAVDHHHGGEFAPREHIIADGQLLVEKEVDRPLIHPLVVPAEQNEVLLADEIEHALLTERSALGREVDAAGGMIGVDRLDGAAHGLRHHHHARAAAEGIVVALAVAVLGIVAQIDDGDLQLSVALRPPENARFERGEHFGKEGENGDLHSTATS